MNYKWIQAAQAITTTTFNTNLKKTQEVLQYCILGKPRSVANIKQRSVANKATHVPAFAATQVPATGSFALGWCMYPTFLMLNHPKI
jgi:hypothetical protein